MAIGGVSTGTNRISSIPINTVDKIQLKEAFRTVCESLESFTSISKKFIGGQFSDLTSSYQNKKREVSHLIEQATGIIKEKISDLKISKKGQTMEEVLSFSGVSLKELQECKEIRDSFWEARKLTEERNPLTRENDFKLEDKIIFLLAFYKELEKCKGNVSIEYGEGNEKTKEVAGKITVALDTIENAATNLVIQILIGRICKQLLNKMERF